MKFIQYAFIGGGAWYGKRINRELLRAGGISCRSVQFDVGGDKFTVQDEDIGKYPTSALYKMMQVAKSQSGSDKEVVKINRSGAIFKHVNTFLLYGHLPRNLDGQVMLPEQTLMELHEEAEFYGLDTLSAECSAFLQHATVPSFQTFFAFQDFIMRMESERTPPSKFHVVASPLLTRALECLWVPFCASRDLYKYEANLEVSDLITAPYDDTQNGTFDASLLNKRELDRIEKALYSDAKLAEFASGLKLSLRARELVIQQRGCAQNFTPVVPVPDNAEHIGLLELILDSSYTGGELEVTHNGHTEVVRGPYTWVAMYGDCLHKMNPITSGTRASLVFDIYGKTLSHDKNDAKTCFDTYFWKYRRLPKAPDLVNIIRPPSVAQQRNIVKCLEDELKCTDSIVVGLQHQYHYNDLRQMPTVDMLTGGDRALYELLTSKSEFDVQIRSFSIHHKEFDWCGKEPTVRPFSPDFINKPSSVDFVADSTSSTVRVGVVMPRTINSKWTLDANRYKQQEMHVRSSVYLVSGLQVSKRKV